MAAFIFGTNVGGALLTVAFQATQPLIIDDKELSLNFDFTVPAGDPRVEFYPEYTDDNPFLAPARWRREVSEELIGNGDVRMSLVIRRFATNGADANLPAGAYNLNVQLRRAGQFVRLQLRGDGVTMTVSAPFGAIPIG